MSNIISLGEHRKPSTPESREKLRLRMLRYRAENKERVNALAKRSKQRHPEYEQNRYARNPRRRTTWAIENPEQQRAYRAKYYKQHRDHILALRLQRHLKNPDKRKTLQAKWKEKNPDKYKKNGAKFRATHREELAVRQSHRRTVKRNGEVGDLRTIANWIKSWRAKKSVTCYWCNNRFPGKNCQPDHIMPIARGGSHTLSNLVVSCKRCNNRKCAILPSKWNMTLDQPRLFL